MPYASPLPEGLSARGFLTSEARRLGVPVDRLRRADLHKPFHGIRVPSAALAALEEHDVRDTDNYWHALDLVAAAKTDAALPLFHDDVVLSHSTAARLHGMPLPARHRRDLSVHVSVSRQQARPQIGGVTPHLAPRDVRSKVLVDGRPLTGPVQTWCALASDLSLHELVAMGDHLVRRIDPPSTMNALAAAVARSAGRHGVKRLRTALELIRPRTDSPKETELRLLLVDAGLPEPEVNSPLFDAFGVLIRHGDLAYPEYGVLVEYNGEQHRTDSAQFTLDTEQLDRIVAAGWVHVQVVKAHLRRPAAVALRVRNALTARGWRP